MLTGMGGILGASIGLSAAFALSLATGLPFSLSPLLVLSAVAVSIAIGMFFGLYPAWRASIPSAMQNSAAVEKIRGASHYSTLFNTIGGVSPSKPGCLGTLSSKLSSI